MINYKNNLILFGGIRELTHERNDIWIFNKNSNEWTILERASTVRMLKKTKKTEDEESPDKEKEEVENEEETPEKKEDSDSKRKFHSSSKN